MLDQRFEIRLLREEMLAGFAQLREEMRAGFAELRGEMTGLRGEMTGLRGELVNQMAIDRAQIVAMHRQINRMLATALVAVIGLLGVLVAKL